MEHVRLVGQPGFTRIERARIIRDKVMAQSAKHGRWETHAFGEGQQARIWHIRPGAGWHANISTPFSLPPSTPPEVNRYGEALLLQLAPPRVDDVVLDLYVDTFSKVLSLGATGGVDTLISMQPGPWEEMFDLESRPWPASVARRLASRAAKA